MQQARWGQRYNSILQLSVQIFIVSEIHKDYKYTYTTVGHVLLPNEPVPNLRKQGHVLECGIVDKGL